MASYSIVRYDGYATTSSSTENITPMVTIDGYDLNGISDNYVLFLDCTVLALSRNGSISGGAYQQLIFAKLNGFIIEEDAFSSTETGGTSPPNAITPSFDQDLGEIYVDVVGPSSTDHCQLQAIITGKVFQADEFT